MTRHHLNGLCAAVLLAAAIAVIAGCEPERIALPAHWEKAMTNVRTVAVMPFEDAAGGEKTKGSGKSVVSAVMSEITKTPGIRVVERAHLDKVMAEQDLKDAFKDATVARKVGGMLGADVVILGEVTQYEAQQEYGHVGVSVVKAGGTTYNHRVGLSVRAVSVADGNVIYSRQGGGFDKTGYPKAIDLATEEAFKPWRQYYEERYAKENPTTAPAKK